MRTATLAWDMNETELHKNAMLCDGDRLVMLTHKDSGVVKRTAGEHEKVAVSMGMRTYLGNWGTIGQHLSLVSILVLTY